MGTLGGGGAGTVQARASWLEDVAQTLGHDTLGGVATLAVDGRTGDVIGTTAAARTLVGFTPTTVDDLVARGVVARPDLKVLRDRVVASVRVAPAGETAERWSTRLRIHPVGGASTVVVLHATHHRRVRMGVEVVWVSILTERDHPAAPPASQPDHAPRRFTSVLDREARIVAIDPRAAVVWEQPDAMIGVLATAILHPEDLERILPVAHAVYSGAVDRSSYTARVMASDGRWVTLHNDLQRVVTGDDHVVVIDNLIVDDNRQLIGLELLTAREVAVVRSLFDGLRPKQIAERDDVSLSTVRNQLASVFRKLGVSGQGELLTTYHRPPD